MRLVGRISKSVLRTTSQMTLLWTSRLLAQIELPVTVLVACGVQPITAAKHGGRLEAIGVGDNRLETAGRVDE